MKNYLFEMLYALTSAYTRKDYDNIKMNRPLETNIGKLFSIFAWGLDLVQEQTELVKLWDNLDIACGSVLDRYGANFGVKRLGFDDRYYRIAIKVKVIAQLSGGDIDTVIRTAASLLEVESSDILLEEVYPAKIAIFVDQHLLTSECLEMIFLLADSIKRNMVAGVDMRLYLRTYRVFREDLSIKQFCYMNSRSTGLPVTKNRTSQILYQMSRSTMYTTKIKGEFLNVKSVQSECMERFRGVCCNVHLRSKRID